ncbi:ABC transporter substrate-binding protein [Desulfobacterales bacterium HSG2]|nr:ABC transporter substrate-binding protein [Desulfobacterales bacterium HSG2]
MFKKGLILSAVILFCHASAYADVVNIGLNYPATGPYADMGKHQIRAAKLATEEINAAGGIAGKMIRLVTRDTKYDSYPSTSAASAYTNLHQYKDAVERAGTFDTKSVVSALEGHKFVSLKDEQMWRKFDHQCVQTVYALKCKPEKEVLKDRFGQDYFEILSTMSGKDAAMDKVRWLRIRKKAGMPSELEW